MQVHDSGLSIITNYGRAASQKREGLLLHITSAPSLVAIVSLLGPNGAR